MKHTLTLAAALLAAASPAWAQSKDKVIKRDQSFVEGAITKDDYKGVVIGSTTIPADQILRVEYKDQPPSWPSAMSAIEEGKWDDAVGALKSAWQRVKEGEIDDKTKKKVTWQVRPWFDQYYLYFLGYVERQLGRFDEALTRFSTYREAKEPGRFWVESFELSMECLREKGDIDGMTKLVASIDTAPTELKPVLQKRAKKQQAELLFEQKKYEDAKKLFETLKGDSDTIVRAESNAGIIKCLEEMKSLDELKRFCESVLKDDLQIAGVKLIASNAIGRQLANAKDHKNALRYFVDSTVRYNPGRGSGFERDHEQALFDLALCYRQLGNAATEKTAKRYYFNAAASAFRETALEYPSGRRRDESMKLADVMAQEAEKQK